MTTVTLTCTLNIKEGDEEKLNLLIKETKNEMLDLIKLQRYSSNIDVSFNLIVNGEQILL